MIPRSHLLPAVVGKLVVSKGRRSVRFRPEISELEISVKEAGHMDSKRALVLVIGVLFILIACSSPAAYGAPPSDPCSLLTQVQISVVLGVQVGEGRRVAPKLCEWAIPGESPSLRQKKVTVTLETEQGFAAAKMPVGHGITKVPASGIGDDAVFGTTPKLATTLAVKKADFFFIVHVFGFPLDQAKDVDEVQAKEKTLALEILSKL